MDVVLGLHLVATVAMTGLIWFVQVVHYPLYTRVGEATFADFHEQHVRRTTMVVAPFMLTEAGTAAWLLLQPPADGGTLTAVGFGLLLVVWLSTGLLQVPRHRDLEVGFDARAVRRLVRSNWVRTVAWSARSGVAYLLLG